MLFIGIAKEFSLLNEDQYRTIGDFSDELSLIYGLENLMGLGYKWENDKIYYAIGLINGKIDNYNFEINIPDEGYKIFKGKTDDLKNIYDEIYKDGPLKYEIETFTNDGHCQIKYYR